MASGDVERQRLLLEDNISKLRRSLRHWQTWEAEYEGLKEEIKGVDGKPDCEALIRIGREYGGNLVNEIVMEELLGLKSGLQRDSQQVIDLISRRQEYIKQNTRTIQKQLEALEDQVSALEGASESATKEVADEDALPLTDITEQLDDDGNVISATTSKPSDVEPNILEALRKAGAKGIQQGQPSVEPRDDRDRDHSARSQATKVPIQADSQARAFISEADGIQSLSSKPSRKSVSFADHTIPATPNTRQKATSSISTEERVSALDVAKDLSAGSRLVELDDDDNILGTTAVEHEESIEDAALRRDMLRYTMQEVGAIVAELDLEEEISDGSDENDDELDDLEGNDFTSDLEEEDQYGRATDKVITDDYRKEMIELEKKLNARMIEVVGPDSEAAVAKLPSAVAVQPGSIDDSVTQRDTNGAKEERSRKKAVTFAEKAEIVLPKSSNTLRKAEETAKSKPRPFAESIMERRSPSTSSAAESFQPRKASRFKSERQTLTPTPAPQGVPEGPAGQILAGNLVERPNTRRSVVAPDPNGFDPALHEREVARQFYDKRNSLIQQRGGFLPSPEDIDNPLMEEKDGKIKKVSRFRAARLNASGV